MTPSVVKSETGTTPLKSGTYTVSGGSGATSNNNDKRQDLERLIKEFQKKLGSNWEKYQESLSLFLMGKLSRKELVNEISPILENGLIKYHNKLLLINLASSFKDTPSEFSDVSSFWNKKVNKGKNVKSSQYERFKSNIMGLPVRERRRIKNITRESGKKGMVNASITLTRQAMLPKIPIVNDKEKQPQISNSVQWQQDVINGIQTNLASESYELPDQETLAAKVIMTMREHGLIGALKQEVLDILLLALETHLKGVVENAIDVVRYRKNKYDYDSDLFEASKKQEQPLTKKRKVTLTIEDLYDTFELSPHLIEPGGPSLRLSSVMLKNDDMADDDDYILPEKPKIELLEPEKKELSNGSAVLNGSANGEELKNGDATPKVGTTIDLKYLLHDILTGN